MADDRPRADVQSAAACCAMSCRSGSRPVVIRDIYDCLGTITAEGTTVVLVEQDINRALDASARFYCFQEGRLALTAPTEGFDRAAITAAYFGLLRAGSSDAVAQHPHSGQPARRHLCAVRDRPVAVVRHHAAGQHRPRRSDRALGLCRLVVGSGHRTRSDLEPRHRRAGDVRARLRPAARPAESNARAAGCCRRCSSPSASRSSSRTGCCRGSAPTRTGCSRARSRPRACSFPAASRSASIRCWSSRVARGRRIGSLQLLFYRTGLGRAFRAASDDADTAELMGIDNRHLYAVALGDRDDLHGDRRRAVRDPHELRSGGRSDPADPRLRGGHHRRARQPVGHADRAAWCSASLRPSARRCRRPGRSSPGTSPF